VIELLASTVFLGYGVTNQIPDDPVPRSADGLELRALWGGDHGDRWSAWIGRQEARETKEGVAFQLHVDIMEPYNYAAVLRRFNKRLDGPVTLFAGTGFGYRDTEMCLTPPYRETGTDRACMPGDAFVTSRWAFAQELGFRWRHVEMSVAHFSTGGWSTSNIGVNMARFTLLWEVGAWSAHR
jgi:hypothetical protein